MYQLKHPVTREPHDGYQIPEIVYWGLRSQMHFNYDDDSDDDYVELDSDADDIPFNTDEAQEEMSLTEDFNKLSR